MIGAVVLHHSVIDVPVCNQFEALHDDRVKSNLSYSEAFINFPF